MVQRDLHHQLVRGVYQIFNLASGTVVDVSLDDRKSVKGHPAHGMLNQQWEVVPLGSGYSFRSILNGHYLTLEKGAHEGAHIMATPYPISWSVEPFYLERESWVIAWPNAPLVFDLHRGSNKPGETIHLCPRRPVEFCQRWRFVPCQDKFLSDPIDEVMSTPTIEPKEHKKPIRNAVTQREVKDAIPSPTTSTVETIVEPEGLVYVDGGDLKITTIITSVTMLKRYPTKPENGKTYRIINGTGDNVIDLHGIDKISIIGHRAHNGPSQQVIHTRRKVS
ncbi:hypothetical protein BDZ94DRAFT_960432 [Collybia nuda]|uniref:Ricin B lectin domain-containing protein n=1 Tax=Collybia nuda TaxID=64659 RepID=A0A9P6CP02_9AGAR|nr:hypothetical protein BDZ94DRAFT_960432 [Collybia nuda]